MDHFHVASPGCTSKWFIAEADAASGQEQRAAAEKRGIPSWGMR